jgi:hypothetical protein
MVYPTATHSSFTVNYNYAHFPYISIKPTLAIPNPTPLQDNDQWIGHKIAVDRSYIDWEMWIDINPFNSNGPANNWTLTETYHDIGYSDYNNIPLTCHKDVTMTSPFASSNVKGLCNLSAVTR